MNGDFGFYEDIMVEDVDLEYDEFDGLESESLESAEAILPAIVGGLGTITHGVTGAIFGSPKSKAPLPRVTSSGGVAGGNIRTPKGTVRFNLPKAVPTLRQYKTLQRVVNGHSRRLNALAKEDKDLRRRIASVLSNVSRDVDKMRDQQQSQAMTNMMIALMTQQQLRRQLEEHTHGTSSAAANIDGGGNSMMMMMMLLPALTGETGDSGDGGMQGMMWLMPLMMMFTQQGGGI